MLHPVKVAGAGSNPVVIAQQELPLVLKEPRLVAGAGRSCWLPHPGTAPEAGVLGPGQAQDCPASPEWHADEHADYETEHEYRKHDINGIRRQPLLLLTLALVVQRKHTCSTRRKAGGSTPPRGTHDMRLSSNGQGSGLRSREWGFESLWARVSYLICKQCYATVRTADEAEEHRRLAGGPVNKHNEFEVAGDDGDSHGGHSSTGQSAGP